MEERKSEHIFQNLVGGIISDNSVSFRLYPGTSKGAEVPGQAGKPSNVGPFA